MSTENANPFRVLRIKRHLSQYDVAKMAKVSKHAVLRLEQGMYEHPLPTLVNFYVLNFKVDRVQLLDDYAEFQINTRKANGRFLGSISELLSAVGPEHHPLTYLRELKGLNPTEVAKRLCISQSAVVYFEKRSVHQHTVPEQLVGALKDAGYTNSEISFLQMHYDNYRAHLINEQQVTFTEKVSA